MEYNTLASEIKKYKKEHNYIGDGIFETELLLDFWSWTNNGLPRKKPENMADVAKEMLEYIEAKFGKQ